MASEDIKQYEQVIDYLDEQLTGSEDVKHRKRFLFLHIWKPHNDFPYQLNVDAIIAFLNGSTDAQIQKFIDDGEDSFYTEARARLDILTKV